ncbi:hypothetical protein DFJ58DRAFT_911289, partial [Suillus subalutaceus]|uniref:uncharacterized protein n=1 Tax=Suillus subalutaceus TaxID=48586 RepID=UPI001B870936
MRAGFFDHSGSFKVDYANAASAFEYFDEDKSESELAELIPARDPELLVTHILVTRRSEGHIREVIWKDVRPLLDSADVNEDIHRFLEASFRKLWLCYSTFSQPTRAQLEWLANQEGDSQAIQPQDPQNLEHSLSFTVHPPEPMQHLHYPKASSQPMSRYPSQQRQNQHASGAENCERRWGRRVYLGHAGVGRSFEGNASLLGGRLEMRPRARWRHDTIDDACILFGGCDEEKSRCTALHSVDNQNLDDYWTIRFSSLRTLPRSILMLAMKSTSVAVEVNRIKVEKSDKSIQFKLQTNARFTMDKRKRNLSRNSTPDTEETAPESSHQPHGRVDRFLENTQELLHHDETNYVLVKGGFKKLRISRLKDSPSRSPVPPNECASSTSVQMAPSGLEMEADTQSALQDTQEAVKHMHSRLGPATTVVSPVQDGQDDLDDVDMFQDTYLEPLRIFDDVIEEIADVHPYAKMALGVLSCAAKIILAKVDRDTAVLKLLEKLGEVY